MHITCSRDVLCNEELLYTHPYASTKFSAFLALTWVFTNRWGLKAGVEKREEIKKDSDRTHPRAQSLRTTTGAPHAPQHCSQLLLPDLTTSYWAASGSSHGCVLSKLRRRQDLNLRSLARQLLSRESHSAALARLQVQRFLQGNLRLTVS